MWYWSRNVYKQIQLRAFCFQPCVSGGLQFSQVLQFQPIIHLAVLMLEILVHGSERMCMITASDTL